ncbi:histidine kinase [Sphaerimonospora cavernae]|uniref:Histidine kinase n=1 Tax=Sphaerimonospora cavernae TaxID=1740611 RepID=A0ABV6UA02_9ACTN
MSAAPRPVRSARLPATPHSEPARPIEGSMDEQLVDIFFDRVPMGIAVFDAEARLLRCNRTWTGFLTHYMGVPDGYASPGRHLYELIPEGEESLAPLLDAVFAGQTVRQAALRLTHRSVVTYWDFVFAPTFRDGEVVGFVDIATDATERVFAHERLEQRVRAFTRLASAMTVDQPLEVILRGVNTAAGGLPGAAGSSVVLRGSGAGSADGLGPEAYADDSFPAGYADALRRTFGDHPLVTGPGRPPGTTLMMRDFRRRNLTDPRFAAMWPFWADAPWDDLAVVPLTFQGRCFGELHVCFHAGAEPADDDEVFLTALADQAAVAVQNADLFGTARQNATLLERQRLARELHDSVSQALFSMTLHARAAQRHLTAAGLDPDGAAVREVERLRELTQGALAEMRALIFELRPGALAEEGLVAALRKQAAAIEGRSGLAIEVTGPPRRPRLEPETEEHLYRLAIEALNNVVKHANAAEAGIQVGEDGPDLVVCITDNGCGFDPEAVPPGRMGRRTMGDRAAAVGGRLEIVSSPGAGTTVRVRVPAVRHSAGSRAAGVPRG